MHVLGNLRIYLQPSHKIKSAEGSLFRRLFPQSAYMHIIREAQKEGILNATVHNSHGSYLPEGKIAVRNVEGDNDNVTMVVELIDTRENLEAFFLKHQTLLQGKVIIYKEVEFWDLQ